MKRRPALTALAMLAAGLAPPALAQLRLPVNPVPEAAAEAPEPEAEEDTPASVSTRPALMIGEDGTVRFLNTPQAAAPEVDAAREADLNAALDSVLLPPAGPVLEVSLDTPEAGPQSVSIYAAGNTVSETVTPDGSTRMIRVDPGNGGPATLITITKN